MLLGSFNHVSIAVADLPAAMRFFKPLLERLGFVPEGKGDGVDVGVVVCVSPKTGGAFNIWRADPELADRAYRRGAPGLHHVALNVESREQVDELCAFVQTLGAPILDPPGEYPYAVGGYYAVYVEGPEGLKIELVYMPELAELHRARGLLGENLYRASDDG